MKRKEIGYRIFVDNRPIEDLTADELEEFRESVVQRMGTALNDYFSVHPEEYVRFCEATKQK